MREGIRRSTPEEGAVAAHVDAATFQRDSDSFTRAAELSLVAMLAGVWVAVPDAVIAAEGGFEAVLLVARGYAGGAGLVGLLVGLADAAITSRARDVARARTFVGAVAAFAVLAVVGPSLFIGERVSQTALATVGPIVLPPLAAIAAVGLARLSARTVPRVLRSRGRIVSCALALALALVLAVAHQHQLCRRYPLVGISLALSATVLTGVAGALLLRRLPRVRAGAPAIAVVLVPVALLVFPASGEARAAIASRGVGFMNIAPLMSQLWDKPRIEHDLSSAAIQDRMAAEHPRVAKAFALSRPRANVVFLVVDSMRRDRWERERGDDFPTLVGMRTRCTAFTRAFAPAPQSGRSIAALWQGRAVAEPSFRSVLSEALAEAGYALSAVAPRAAFQAVERRGSIAAFRERHVIEAAGAASGWGGGIRRLTGREASAAALSQIDRARARQEPFALWVQYFSAHQWDHLPELGSLGSPRERYDAALVDDDRGVALLLAGLEERGVLDETVVVLLADHGESLGDNGWMTHGVWLYPELVHVPLAICVPGNAPREVDVPVGLVSIAATIGDILDIDVPAPPEGASLAPLMIGEATAAHPRPILMESQEERGIIHEDRFLRLTVSVGAVQSRRLSDAIGSGGPNVAEDADEIVRTRRLLAWIGVAP